MIGMGILSLIFGILENFTTIKGLRGRYDVRRKRYALMDGRYGYDFRPDYLPGYNIPGEGNWHTIE